MTIGAVDCDDSSNKKLCANQGVTHFPTIKLYGGDKMKNPYTEAFYKEATNFSGSVPEHLEPLRVFLCDKTKSTISCTLRQAHTLPRACMTRPLHSSRASASLGPRAWMNSSTSQPTTLKEPRYTIHADETEFTEVGYLPLSVSHHVPLLGSRL